MSLVEDLLQKYSLNRETAEKYIDATVRLNQVETAEEISVSREWVRQYKNKFQEMKPMERALLISELMEERFKKEVIGGENPGS